MSVPRRNLRLSPRAQNDLRAIRIYGLRTWDERQADRYDAALHRVFDRLRDNPLVGIARSDLEPGLRSPRVELHVLFYRVAANVIEIVRILHVHQDVGSALPPLDEP